MVRIYGYRLYGHLTGDRQTLCREGLSWQEAILGKADFPGAILSPFRASPALPWILLRLGFPKL